MTTYSLDDFLTKLKELKDDDKIANENANEKIVSEIIDYVKNGLLPKLGTTNANWLTFPTFWPPRCVEAIRDRKAIIFFGSGLSMSCGIPTWNKLLSESFGLDKTIIDDKELLNDPLTLAELASKYIGNDILQETLRKIMNKPHKFSINHATIAALRCPYYITTNYDCLFEKAWENLNQDPLNIVKNDIDLATITPNKTTLFKIHGSSNCNDEHLILNRTDYRFHYRVNKLFFEKIRELIRNNHIIFTGFGHKDPEVSRLVEDAIYEYEKSKKNNHSTKPPHFYSLQFDMGSHTPEIFAARGIVALKPKILAGSSDEIKTKSLAGALIDLLGAAEKNLHSVVSLDSKLLEAKTKISKEISTGLEAIKKKQTNALAFLEKTNSDESWIKQLCSELKGLASQGVYLCDYDGKVILYEVPTKLQSIKAKRMPKITFNQRPYFRQAKSFRTPFVSDTAESHFNKNSTFFLCAPIYNKIDKMCGLLFSASQIGQWNKILNIAKFLWKSDTKLSFLLIDSNGICLIPPKHPFAFNYLDPDKPGIANKGYLYEELEFLSKRDVLISHISKSVVPLAQDDDVLDLSEKLKQFTVVSEVENTRWKIGISISIKQE